MTSGTFAIVALDSITVNRDDRQRRELTDIEALAESIRQRGLINPLVVDKDHLLIAGERRYTACKSLGLTEVAVQYIDDLSPFDREMIELEENVRRVDLPWRDYVATISRLHAMNSSLAPDWTQEQTAAIVGRTADHVQQVLLVDRNLSHELVKDAPKFSVALNAARRYEERKAAGSKRELSAMIDNFLPASAPEPEIAAPEVFAEIIQTDFNSWARNYSGTPFNLIHCDFPYGVNAGDTTGMSAAKILGSYADTPEIFFELLSTLTDPQNNFIAESAHLVFWFSMDFYQQTREALIAAGWTVSPFPLIWFKTDNTGILPDPNRGPRRVYETALFASRGDRKIVKAVGNAVGTAATKELHTSEKPRTIFHHFFRMLVDDTTRLLDPTAGSGNAVRVAAELGAAYALGLELNPEFAEAASGNVARAGELNL